LDNLYAVRTALTEVFQALGSSQLEPHTAGKMLYAIQLVNSVNRRLEKQAAAAAAKDAVPQSLSRAGRGIHAPLLGANLGSCDDSARVQECPGFEQKFGLPPGADLDAETDAALRHADDEAQYRQGIPIPLPPPGMRPGSPAYRIYREEAYQTMQLELKRLRNDLRDYHQQKSRKLEEMIKKEMQSVTTQPDRRADTA
ncbi:MAG TPA: hypothetical protein VE779_06525, partial [Candidatus Angelobacter sp.]|nr:hypothetical protein [Candidatus Angelobacter sp.]